MQVPADFKHIRRLIAALHGVADFRGLDVLVLFGFCDYIVPECARLVLRRGYSGIRTCRCGSQSQRHCQRQRQRGGKFSNFLEIHDSIQPFFQQRPALPQCGGGRIGLVAASDFHSPQQRITVAAAGSFVQFPQYRLVTGKLAGTFRLPAHPMDQWVEPVDADRQLYQPLIGPVLSPAVGQFVAQHPPQVLLRQLRAGQYDLWSEGPQQQRRSCHGVDVHFHRTFYSDCRPGFRRQIQNCRVVCRRPACLDIADEVLVGGYLPDQQRQRPRQPYHPQVVQCRRADFPQPGGGLRLLDWFVIFRVGVGDRGDLRDACGVDGGPLYLPGQLLRRAALRPEGQQQPQYRYQPDVVLPPPADPLSDQPPQQPDCRDHQRPGQGQRQDHFQSLRHFFPSSQNRFNSS